MTILKHGIGVCFTRVVLGTVLLVLGLSALADVRVIREFHYGSGEAELGLIEGAEDVLGVGPAAIAVRDGTFFLLDRVKSRVLRFRGSKDQPSTIDLGTEHDPIDLVVLGNTLYFTDAARAGILRVDATGSGAAPTIPGQTEAGGAEMAVHAAASALFQQGFWVGTSAAGVPEVGSSELSSAYSPSPEGRVVGDPGQRVIASNSQSFLARFVPSPLPLGTQKAEYRGDLIVAPAAAPEQSQRLVIRRPSVVKAARLAAIAADGRWFLDLDEVVNLPTNGEILRHTVVEYDAGVLRLGVTMSQAQRLMNWSPALLLLIRTARFTLSSSTRIVHVLSHCRGLPPRRARLWHR